MIARFLSTHVPPMFIGSGVGITILHYAFDRMPYVSVGAGFAIVLAGFLVGAVFSKED
jgi:ABC-type transport system involved in cytochrome c biogenesis permease subunit